MDANNHMDETQFIEIYRIKTIVNG